MTTWKSAEELAEQRGLPDPFVRADGRRLRNREEWPAQRAFLKQVLQHYVYGCWPERPTEVQETDKVEESFLDGAARQVAMTLQWDNGHQLPLRLVVPVGAGPFPVIVRLDHMEDRMYRPDIEDELLNEGHYAFMTVSRRLLAPDEAASPDVPMLNRHRELQLGAIGMWGFGLTVALDWLLKQPCVDPDKIAVTGHSRDGKAVMLAGAFDERIAVVAPNGSGLGGAGSWHVRNKGAEPLSHITQAFPHWFSPALAAFFGGKESRLPVDAVFLRALIAPRAFLNTEAANDHWANPYGAYVSNVAAAEVYRMLGANPERIGMTVRAGDHDHTDADWAALVEFCDWIFFDRKPSLDFNLTHYPDVRKEWHWPAPDR